MVNFQNIPSDPKLHPRWPPSVDNVKNMLADGGHLGWRSGSQDIILKVDHLRTIYAMFVLN
jgi:hypothetical protein